MNMLTIIRQNSPSYTYISDAINRIDFATPIRLLENLVTKFN